MSIESKLIQFFKEQIKIENEIFESLNKALVNMENPAVKGTLKGISLDSSKHAQMYTSAMELLTKTPKALAQEELDKQKKLVKWHINLEARLIKKISEEMPNIRNRKVKLLLDAILQDEKRHHALLKQVQEILIRGETITDEEWFDVMWGAVPFHGSPGG